MRVMPTQASQKSKHFKIARNMMWTGIAPVECLRCEMFRFYSKRVTLSMLRFSLLALVTFVNSANAYASDDQGIVDLGEDAVYAYNEMGNGIVAWTPGNPIRVIRTLTGEDFSKLKVPPSVNLAWLGVGEDWSVVALTDTGAVYRWDKANGFAPRELELTEKLRQPAGMLAGGMFATVDDETALILQGDEVAAQIESEGRGDLLGVFENTLQEELCGVFEKGARWYDVENETTKEVEFAGEAFTAFRSPEGEYVAVVGSTRIELIDLSTKEAEYVEKDGSGQVMFCGAEDEYLVFASNENRIDVWDLSAGLKNYRYDRSIDDRVAGAVVAIQGTDILVYCGETRSGRDPCLIEYDLSSKQQTEHEAERILQDENWDIHLMAGAASKNKMVLQSGRGLVTVWNISTLLNVVGQKANARNNLTETFAVERTVSPQDRVRHIDMLRSGSGAIIVHESASPLYLCLAASYSPVEEKRIRFVRDGGSVETVRKVDVAPNGKTAVAVLGSGVSVLDTKSGKERGFIKGSFMNAAVSVDGRRVFLARSNGGEIVDLETGRMSGLLPWNPKPFSTRGRLISGLKLNDGRMGVIDVSIGEIVSLIECSYVQAGGKTDVSPDRARFAVGNRLQNGSGYGIEFFDLKSGEGIGSIPVEGRTICGIAVLSGENEVAVCNESGVKVYDYRRRRVVREFPVHVEQVSDEETPVAATAIASLSWRDESNSGWSTNDSRFIDMKPGLDDRALIVASDNVGVWNLASGQPIWRLPYRTSEYSLGATSGNVTVVANNDGELSLIRSP